MAEKLFEGLAAFAEFLERGAVLQEAAIELTAEATSLVLEEKIKAVYGDAGKLPELAESTQADRAAKGYTPNDPLLRSGELLRDSVHHEHAGRVAIAASDEPVAAYSERGFYNHRSGKMVPPRPAFKIGLEEALPEAMEIASIATFCAANGIVKIP